MHIFRKRPRADLKPRSLDSESRVLVVTPRGQLISATGISVAVPGWASSQTWAWDADAQSSGPRQHHGFGTSLEKVPTFSPKMIVVIGEVPYCSPHIVAKTGPKARQLGFHAVWPNLQAPHSYRQMPGIRYMYVVHICMHIYYSRLPN